MLSCLLYGCIESQSPLIEASKVPTTRYFSQECDSVVYYKSFDSFQLRGIGRIGHLPTSYPFVAICYSKTNVISTHAFFNIECSFQEQFDLQEQPVAKYDTSDVDLCNFYHYSYFGNGSKLELFYCGSPATNGLDLSGYLDFAVEENLNGKRLYLFPNIPEFQVPLAPPGPNMLREIPNLDFYLAEETSYFAETSSLLVVHDDCGAESAYSVVDCYETKGLDLFWFRWYPTMFDHCTTKP